MTVVLRLGVIGLPLAEAPLDVCSTGEAGGWIPKPDDAGLEEGPAGDVAVAEEGPAASGAGEPATEEDGEEGLETVGAEDAAKTGLLEGDEGLEPRLTVVATVAADVPVEPTGTTADVGPGVALAAPASGDERSAGATPKPVIEISTTTMVHQIVRRLPVMRKCPVARLPAS